MERPPARILLVEDSDADLLLIRRLLKGAPVPVEIHRVQDEGSFLSALAEFGPELILADYRLPRFSGMRALDLARAHDPDLPVIIVTGHLSEHEAISCLRAGASSYVLKDNIVRLLPEVVVGLDRASERRARREAEAAREASEKRFRAVAAGSPDAVLIADGEGSIVFWNSAASRIFGYSSEEVRGRPFWILIPERFRVQEIAAWAVLAAHPEDFEAFTGVRTAVRKDGAELPVEMAVSGWREGDRGYSSVFMRDISDRVAGERTQRLLSAAIANTTNLVAITDPDGLLEYANAAFERMSGYTTAEMAGKPLPVLERGIVPSGVEAEVRLTLSEGRTWVGELPNRRKDGTEYLQRITALPVRGEDGVVEHLLFIAQDLSEERSLERQLRQAQKMEGLGLVAGGIAHDFNNSLTSILATAQLLLLHEESRRPWCAEGLRDIESAASMGADLVRGLMGFARDERPRTAPMRVAPLLGETGRMLRRVLPATIELTLDPGPDDAGFVADRAGLQQVLVNLATNARDAMPDGGSLHISAVSDGGKVSIRVRDTGHGMSPDLLERVFDPFVTTKPEGRGTGLGLTMARRLVERMGGGLNVESRVGEGTTFTLTFPSVAGIPSAAPPLECPAEVGMAPGPKRKGRVLVIEDEEPIRRAARRVLVMAGYEVLEARDGEAGIGILDAGGHDVGLVVSDVTMPRLSGRLLVEALADREVPLVLMSGQPLEESAPGAGLPPGARFLRKPWTVDDLCHAVREALADTRNGHESSVSA